MAAPFWYRMRCFQLGFPQLWDQGAFPTTVILLGCFFLGGRVSLWNLVVQQWIPCPALVSPEKTRVSATQLFAPW